MWAAGVTAESTKEILQLEYLGDIGNSDPSSLNRTQKVLPYGCGMIPRDDILEIKMRRGAPEAVETVRVAHYDADGKRDGISTLTFKSYDQGRDKFQGTTRQLIHLDEEPPVDIYDECLMRLAGVKGQLILTMTPLKGMTDVCEMYLDDTKKKATRAVVQMGWDEADHLSDEEKTQLLDGMPLHQREAREKGIPALGSGKIYPVPESFISIPDFEIPTHFRRAFGIDFGWTNPTAIIWGAVDPNTDICYLYQTHRESEQEPIYHAAAVKRSGKWIPGVCDPAGGGSSQSDGQSMIDLYGDEGVYLTKANNSVESGIMEVLNMMKTGKLKVFESLEPWWREFRRYSRNEKGQVNKKEDHLMDATRYLIKSGLVLAKSQDGYRGIGIRRAMYRPDWKTV